MPRQRGSTSPRRNALRDSVLVIRLSRCQHCTLGLLIRIDKDRQDRCARESSFSKCCCHANVAPTYSKTAQSAEANIRIEDDANNAAAVRSPMIALWRVCLHFIATDYLSWILQGSRDFDQTDFRHVVDTAKSNEKLRHQRG